MEGGNELWDVLAIRNTSENFSTVCQTHASGFLEPLCSLCVVAVLTMQAAAKLKLELLFSLAGFLSVF